MAKAVQVGAEARQDRSDTDWEGCLRGTECTCSGWNQDSICRATLLLGKQVGMVAKSTKLSAASGSLTFTLQSGPADSHFCELVVGLR